MTGVQHKKGCASIVTQPIKQQEKNGLFFKIIMLLICIHSVSYPFLI